MHCVNGINYKPHPNEIIANKWNHKKSIHISHTEYTIIHLFQWLWLQLLWVSGMLPRVVMDNIQYIRDDWNFTSLALTRWWHLLLCVSCKSIQERIPTLCVKKIYLINMKSIMNESIGSEYLFNNDYSPQDLSSHIGSCPTRGFAANRYPTLPL